MTNILMTNIRCDVCFAQEVFTEMYPCRDGALCKGCYERGSQGDKLLDMVEQNIPIKISREIIFECVQDEAKRTVETHKQVENILKYGPVAK